MKLEAKTQTPLRYLGYDDLLLQLEIVSQNSI